MNKQQIIKTINKSCGHTSIQLPRDIDFQFEDGVLTIQIKKAFTCKNMQIDSAAFEGWAIVLKRWIDDIKLVIIKWEEPILEDDSNEMQHYQRFLYRVKKFAKVYAWANIHQDNTQSLNISKIYNGEKNILNIPTRKRPRAVIKKTLMEYSENELENYILSDSNTLELFKKNFDLKIVDSQLPVGVFDKKKSEYTRIFPGRKSAIDIWGITNDQKTCCIFELKDADNKKVGALSEMLFYSFVIQDVINGKMEFYSLKYPGLKEITEAEKVKCFLLAPNTHPLIDTGVFQLLNDSNSKIVFKNAKITNNLTF